MVLNHNNPQNTSPSIWTQIKVCKQKKDKSCVKKEKKTCKEKRSAYLWREKISVRKK